MNNDMVSIKTVAKFLDGILDAPCNYEFFNESAVEFIFKNNEDWCEKCCPNDGIYTCCWEEYLKHKLKELDITPSKINEPQSPLLYLGGNLEDLRRKKEAEVQYYE